ncbi:uncharacterized protein CTRU02_214908 [Colletotrichum truncatum]|uniref:Uncharacterized protein n=1 Tax=Colletotrichum truncatum TaxID=5467 RepID=A0ACC3YE35_COLTU|nr:uncharacterized protein CTRU02_08338 [Colletotrichum truncatum]KAF6790209.1 hypothetical protein CTRU02_08338 [Colletotrichum truncatum]
MFIAIILTSMGFRVYIRGYSLKIWGLDDSIFILSSVVRSCFCHSLPSCIWFHQSHFFSSTVEPLALISFKCFDSFLVVVLITMFGMTIYSGVIWGPLLLGPSSYTDGSLEVVVWGYISSGITLVTDIIIFLLPMPILIQLHLAPAQKLGLISCFGVGLFTSAISVYRFTNFTTGLRDTDITYNCIPLSIISQAETTSAIVCACVPLLRPILSSLIDLGIGSQITREKSPKIKSTLTTPISSLSPEKPDPAYLHTAGDF